MLRLFLATCAAGLCLVLAGQSCVAGDQDYPSDSNTSPSSMMSIPGLKPEIVTRDEWQAKPPLQGMKKQNPTAIIIHNSGVLQNKNSSLEQKLLSLQIFSQRPGIIDPNIKKPIWPDVPYHFYIDMIGRVAEGRDINFEGDTNTRYDTSGYIQIVVEGDFDNETPSQPQIFALEHLLVWLLISRNISMENISVHKDHAATTCPGSNFMSIFSSVIDDVKKQRSQAIVDFCKQQELKGRSPISCVK
jgi:N-acetylmuramoyl-L-alanine amidase-like protein